MTAGRNKPLHMARDVDGQKTRGPAGLGGRWWDGTGGHTLGLVAPLEAWLL